MPAKIKVTPSVADQAEALFNQGYSLTAISQQLGVYVKGIRAQLKKRGYRTGVNKKRRAHLDPKSVLALYLEGATCNGIAKACHTSRQAIHALLTRELGPRPTKARMQWLVLENRRLRDLLFKNGICDGD